MKTPSSNNTLFASKSLDTVHQKNETILRINVHIAVSAILMLGWFYFMSESRPGTITEEAKSAIAASIGIDDVSAKNKKNTPKQLTISSSVLDFASVLAKPLDKTRFSRVWGLQNIALTPENDLRVFYPKGSFSPSSAPLGGAGFIYKLDTPIDTGRLSYQVKFEKGFNFVKGWKLPGFCSLNCPSGGTDVGNGFSTRFMWRANGDMEVYAYTPGKTETFGKSLGRGFFRFETDRAYTVEQVLKLNTPGLNDGSIVVNVDGKEVFRDTAVNFRLSGITHIDSVMFSTFFWGGDLSYAAQKDEYVRFKNFTVTP